MAKACIMKNLIALLLLLNCLTGNSQDPEFSQYNSASLYLNPGLAGANGCGKAAAGYRNQWPAISGSFQSIYAGYDHYLHGMRGGLGLYYMRDWAGEATLVTDRTALVYAAHLRLFNDKLVIRPGVEIAYIQKTVDWSKLTFGDQIDPRRGFIYTTAEQQQQQFRKNIVDISSGVFMYSKYVYGGFAAHHLTQPDEGFLGTSRLPMKLTLHGGGIISRQDSAARFTFYPHFIYQRQQDFQQLLTGVSMRYKQFICGLAYRVNDAAILQLGYQNQLFTAAYSYDNTISALSNATGGSHELMLSFNILHRKEKKIVEFKGVPF